MQVSARGEFASRIRNALRPGGNDGNVIGAGDRDRERKGGLLGVQIEVVVDDRRIGQRQGLAGGEKIKGIVRDGIGPARRTVVVVAGIRRKLELDFYRRDVGQLLRVQPPGDVAVRGVLIGERRQRRRNRRCIALVDVSEADTAGGAVGSAVAGLMNNLGYRETIDGDTVEVEDSGLRRTGNMRAAGYRSRGWARRCFNGDGGSEIQNKRLLVGLDKIDWLERGWCARSSSTCAGWICVMRRRVGSKRILLERPQLRHSRGTICNHADGPRPLDDYCL